MKLVKIFTGNELKLSQDEEHYLCERCRGSADSCYEKITVLSWQDALDEYADDEIIMCSVMEKLRDIGKVEVGETVMIDLCW